MNGAEKVDQLRAAGFPDPEIQAWVGRRRQTMVEAGFGEVDINTYFGRPPIDDAPIQKWVTETVDSALDSFIGPDDEAGERPDLLPLLKKSMEVGYQNSVVGLYNREQLPDIELSPDAPMAARLASQMTGLALDFPIMVGGAVLGAPFGTVAAGPGPGTLAGAGAGAFALPAIARESLMQSYRQGSVDSFEEYYQRVGALFLEGAQGAATGASVMTAGALQKGPLSKFAAELTTLVTVQKGLEGEIPSADDFLEGAVVLLALKGATRVSASGANLVQRQTVKGRNVLQDIYARTGKRPQDVLADTKTDPTVLEDVMSMLDPNSKIPAPRAYESLLEKVELPPKPTPITAVKEVLSDAKQVVMDRISVGEREAPPAFRQRVDNLYTEGVDKLYPLARLVDELRQGEKIDANLDPYKGARFLPAASAKAQLFLDFEVRKFGSNEVVSKGLKQILEPVKNDLDGIRAYAVSKRSLELEARGVPTGVPKAEAKRVVKEGNKKYGKVFKELKTYQTALTEYLRDSGIISEEMFTKMQEANKDYVPFHRLFDPSETPGLGKGTKVRSPIKKIKGSERVVLDPLESIIKNTYLYTNLAERNAVNVKLVELAERKGGTGKDALVEKVKQPRVPTTLDAKEMQKIADEVSREFGVEFTPEELTVFRARTLQPTDSQFVAFRNGKRELFEVDKEVGVAMNGLDGGMAGLLSKFLTVPAKTLRAGAILNPEFFAKNVIRDTVSATVMSTRGFLPFVDTVLGGMSLISKDTAFRDWMMSGGANATLVSIDRLYLQQSLQNLTKQTGLMSRAVNVVTSPLEVLRVGSELAENATRLGAFKRKTRGKRTQKALAEGAFESREVTLDFARMGLRMKGYNQISAFLNARVQGYDRIVRGFKDNPVRMTAKAAAVITLPSIALWMANHNDPRWKEIPQWQKDMFWIVMTDENVYRIPKPFELGILFGTVPEHLLEAFFEDNPKAMEGIIDAFSSDSLSSVFPTAVTPIVENVTNFSFFRGGPVIPHRVERMLPEYQYTEYTTELAKKVGTITGQIGITPIDVENYVRQWSGGLGNYALRLADLGLRKAGLLPDPPRPADTLADIPFVKAFVIRHPSAGAQPIIDFYDELDRQNKIAKTFLSLAVRGEEVEAQKVLAMDPSALAALNTVRTTLGEHSSMARVVFANPTIPRDEKRQLIDQIYKAMSIMAQAGNTKMEK